MESEPPHLDGPPRPRRANHSEPMVVKYWSRAGIMLTDWCSAACACCYAACSPRGVQWLGVDDMGANVPSGIYFYQILVDDGITTVRASRQMALVR